MRGTVHDRPCDRDALTLPAGELVRVAFCHRRIEPDLIEHLPDARATVAGDPERPQRLGDDLPGAHPGVERRIRILEHEPGCPPQPVQRTGRCRGIHVLPVDAHGAGGRAVEAQEKAHERRLARAGLADDADRFAGLDVEVRRRQRGLRAGALEHGPLREGELPAQPSCLDETHSSPPSGRHSVAVASRSRP